MQSICSWLLVSLSLTCTTCAVASVVDNDNLITIQLGGVAHTIKDGDDGAYVCVTMDWWPANKCDYGVCPWKNDGSILRADLENKRMQNLLQSLHGVTLRIGGTQADTIVYEDTDTDGEPCLPFEPSEGPARLFEHGCLTRQRWRQIAQFAQITKTKLIFGINALAGRQYWQQENNTWDTTNAASFLLFLQQNPSLYDQVIGFQLGNELNILPRLRNMTITPRQHAESFWQLHRILERVFGPKASQRFKLWGPDQSFKNDFFDEFLPLVQGDNNDSVLAGVTWHSYPLGPGYGNPHLLDTIMNPKHLDSFGEAPAKYMQSNYPDLQLIMGETGGAYNSGHDTVNNRFADAFWYLQGMAQLAQNRHDMFCRQTLVGGNYELLDTKTTDKERRYYPNPSYFAAYLFSKVMGSQVRHVNLVSMAGTISTKRHLQDQSTPSTNDPPVRVFAHCNLKQQRLGLLLLNYDNTTVFSFDLKQYVSKDYLVPRDEYHMTATSLHAQQVQCNGETIDVDERGNFHLEPRRIVDSTKVVARVAPESYTFVYFDTESGISQTECREHSNTGGS